MDDHVEVTEEQAAVLREVRAGNWIEDKSEAFQTIYPLWHNGYCRIRESRVQNRGGELVVLYRFEIDERLTPPPAP